MHIPRSKEDINKMIEVCKQDNSDERTQTCAVHAQNIFTFKSKEMRSFCISRMSKKCIRTHTHQQANKQNKTEKRKVSCSFMPKFTDTHYTLWQLHLLKNFISMDCEYAFCLFVYFIQNFFFPFFFACSYALCAFCTHPKDRLE